MIAYLFARDKRYDRIDIEVGKTYTGENYLFSVHKKASTTLKHPYNHRFEVFEVEINCQVKETNDEATTEEKDGENENREKDKDRVFVNQIKVLRLIPKEEHKALIFEGGLLPSEIPLPEDSNNLDEHGEGTIVKNGFRLYRERSHVWCSNGKCDITRESEIHDPLGRLVFWTEHSDRCHVEHRQYYDDNGNRVRYTRNDEDEVIWEYDKDNRFLSKKQCDYTKVFKTHETAVYDELGRFVCKYCSIFAGKEDHRSYEGNKIFITKEYKGSPETIRKSIITIE